MQSVFVGKPVQVTEKKNGWQWTLGGVIFQHVPVDAVGNDLRSLDPPSGRGLRLIHFRTGREQHGAGVCQSLIFDPTETPAGVKPKQIPSHRFSTAEARFLSEHFPIEVVFIENERYSQALRHFPHVGKFDLYEVEVSPPEVRSLLPISWLSP